MEGGSAAVILFIFVLLLRSFAHAAPQLGYTQAPGALRGFLFSLRGSDSSMRL